ncbi:hypothetical protein N658DRAFT_475342 [Parathielavia hyrcaniae]|uniref:Uncharacterized protein n=1 Tax=Parathielavia hyrcaniae TaxID=113614 RepID=A0AAN6Q063_9PEZI|nr:hypothetical protein N658DRAFT_475342 [Parathielavia hyrcaniae]
MTQPMLSLDLDKLSKDIPKATPHVLPCRIYHNGPVEPVQSFWDSKVGNDGTGTAHFRGRKLQAATVKLPEGYRGVVAVTSGPEEPSRRPEEAEVIDLEAGMPQGSLTTQAEFDDMVVWGHESAVDPSADPYLRAAGEWLALAEKIHTYPAPTAKEK